MVYALSSIDSTIAQPYPIDSICISTPCSFHIPVGRAGKTKEVAKGLAIPVEEPQQQQVDPDIPPQVIRVYKKEGSDIAGRWHASNKAAKMADKMTAKTADNTQDIRRPGYYRPRTNIKYNLIIGVNDIPDLSDCPQRFEYENNVHVAKQKAGYLDPYAICEVRHNFPSKWGDNHDKLAKCKTNKEKKAKRLEKHKKATRKVSAYIAHMMITWQDRHPIWAPYNFQAYQYNINRGGIYNPERSVEMDVCTNFPYHKQPSCFVHYRYYVFEHIRVLGRYTTDPER
uniref:Uncharacterized protein n=1 Tax=Setaria italica TaxID=4555 RepID=A0A0Q3RJW4_SETIT